MTKDEARSLLKSHGLRSTGPRVAVLRVLATADRPLSYREVHGRIDRYALAGADQGRHRHPHFLCEDCGLLACLPADVVSSTSAEGPWAASIERAMVQLRGTCPDCLEA